MSRKAHKTGSQCGWRRGTAVVEVAVCLPLIVLLAFASIEACTMVYLKQSLTIAAYEGGRTAIRPGATSTDAIANAQQVLLDRNVQGANVTTTPADITMVPTGGYLDVRVTAPCNQNLLGGAWFFQDKTLVGEATFMKEY